MKLIPTLLFLIGITTYSFSQNPFVAEVGTRFIDFNGTTFFGSIVKNNEVHLTEFSAEGLPMWNDTVHFYIPNAYLNKYYIARFPNSDNYAVIIQSDYNSNFADDTTRVFQSFLFNGSAKSISSGQVDTMSTTLDWFSVGTGSTDGLLLFVPRHKPLYTGLTSYSYEPFKLDETLNYSVLAPFDSIITNNTFQINFNETNDTIVRLEITDDYVSRGKYRRADFSIIDTVFTRSLEYNFGIHNSNSFTQQINEDTLVVVIHEKDEFENEDIGFHFYYLNKNLDIIFDSTIVTPIGNDSYTSLKYFKNHFYFFPNVGFPGVNQSTLYRYDMNLNLECEIPTFSSVSMSRGLSVINDKFYFNQYAGGNQDKHWEINGCEVSLGVKEQDNFNLGLYPNPASDNITIELQGGDESQVFEVINLLGTVIEKGLFYQGKNELSISTYLAGRYIIRIVGNEYLFNESFVKF